MVLEELVVATANDRSQVLGSAGNGMSSQTGARPGGCDLGVQDAVAAVGTPERMLRWKGSKGRGRRRGDACSSETSDRGDPPGTPGGPVQRGPVQSTEERLVSGSRAMKKLQRSSGRRMFMGCFEMTGAV